MPFDKQIHVATSPLTNRIYAGYVLKAPYRGCYVNLKVTFVAGKAFKAQSGEIEER